jgi:uncharacterized protein YjaZ
MAFKSELTTSASGFGKSRLAMPLHYYSKRLEMIITVPTGFETDYASIPRFFQLFISKLGRHRKAAVVHDYLYSYNNRYKYLTRAQCDFVFLDGMIEEGVPRWKAYSMFNTVRIFGSFAGFRKKG